MKTNKYSIYPSSVFKGDKQIMTLNDNEYEFLKTLKTNAKKDYYINNPFALKKDAQIYSMDSGVPIKEARKIMGFSEPEEEDFDKSCSHNYRLLREDKFTGLFFCTHCLMIKSKILK